jgi:pimeloyl-ACP methyl ester carboxylesterase
MQTTNHPMLSHAISRDGTEIGYFTSGDGPPVLLVHGGLADHTRFAALRPHLEPHVTVHVMDRRGRGASGDHPDYSIKREYEDVAAVVDDVAESSSARVTVYGHSSGGILAFGAALLTANIDRLVVYEGWPPTTADLWNASLAYIERMEALLEAGERERVVETIARELAGLSEEELDAYRADPSWAARVAVAHTFPREERGSAETAFDREHATNVAVPALLVVGDQSPPSWRADADSVAAALPDAHTIVLQEQGHGADILAAEMFAQHLLGFIGQPT